MNAYICDLCGDCFVELGQFRIASPAGMYYTLFKNDAGNVIDICNFCRCRLQDVLDTIRYEREQAEHEEITPALKRNHKESNKGGEPV